MDLGIQELNNQTPLHSSPAWSSGPVDTFHDSLSTVHSVHMEPGLSSYLGNIMFIAVAQSKDSRQLLRNDLSQFRT